MNIITTTANAEVQRIRAFEIMPENLPMWRLAWLDESNKVHYKDFFSAQGAFTYAQETFINTNFRELAKQLKLVKGW